MRRRSRRVYTPPATGGGGVDPIQAAIDGINSFSPALFYWGNNVILDAGNAESGDQVSQWTDLSGNGRHATQSTQDDQPTRVLVGTSYGLQFDNDDGTAGDKMTIPFAWANGLTGLTVFLAIQLAETSGVVQDLFSLDGADWMIRVSSSGASMRVFAGGSLNYENANSAVDTNLHVYTAMWDGSVPDIVIERDSTGLTTTAGGTLASSLAITSAGFIGAQNATTSPCDVTMFALVAVPNAVSAGNRNTIRAHLKTLVPELP